MRQSKLARESTRRGARLRESFSSSLPALSSLEAEQRPNRRKLLSALSLGGRGGGGRNLNAELVKKLPPEIVSYILLLAASPHTPDAVPCKIALLSKAHYRLVIPKLYAHVQLNDGHTFRRFRLTMALHNPSLGRLVKSLQIASADFDDSGYLPGQLAENVALGVGLEQILLACSNLSDLYLDLLAMAALHNGTASRLERGALPVRLSAELSIPQYLAVPTFASLRHVELNVFGLDADAIEDLRTVLPRLKSLTFRWVTRGSYRPPALRNVLSAYDWRGARGVDRRRRRRPSMSRQGSTSSLNSSGGSGSGNMHHHGGAFSHEESQDMSIDDDDDETEEERAQWRPGGRKHSDLCLFAHAIDVLRRWPQEPSDGKPLRALTVLAWPKAVRMLREFFPDAVLLDETGSADEQAWDWSMERAYDEDDEEEGKGEEQDGGEGGRGGLKKRPNFSRASRRMGPAGHRPPPVHVQAAGGPATMGVRMARNPSSLSQHSRSGDTKLAPLRIGIDDAYQQGPRRGPLQQWQARTASCDIWR